MTWTSRAVLFGETVSRLRTARAAGIVRFEVHHRALGPRMGGQQMRLAEVQACARVKGVGFRPGREWYFRNSIIMQIHNRAVIQ